MANYQNHVIDPTFFYDAIEQFAFDYDCYIVTGTTIDDYGREVHTFSKQTVRGSLQSEGTRLVQTTEGNREEMTYSFYCKSLYRLKIGDFIYYKKRWLHIDNVEDFDEWGVRQMKLTMVNLVNYKDLAEYFRYINGEDFV